MLEADSASLLDEEMVEEGWPGSNSGYFIFEVRVSQKEEESSQDTVGLCHEVNPGNLCPRTCKQLC